MATPSLAQRAAPGFEAQASKLALVSPKSLPNHQYTMKTAKIKYQHH
ncbi:hypothetical protein A2U01_0112840, partial [Trifolium medium]|nr:hypothetical protein [Trifolium medium]